jgi:uncharacterized membrane protein YidH (DUF202 family)
MNVESTVRGDNAPPRTQHAGLQAQRTALSWNRTGLAVLANALLALRSGWANREAPVTALALALLVAAGAVMIYGTWRRQHILDEGDSIASSALSMAAISVVAMVACVTGTASLLLSSSV